MSKQSYVLLHLIREGAVDAGELKRGMQTFENIYARQQQQQASRMGNSTAGWEAAGSTNDVEAPDSPSPSSPSASPNAGPRMRSGSSAAFCYTPSFEQQEGLGLHRSIEIELED